MQRILQQGASVNYIDRPRKGEEFSHENITIDIDRSADTYTSLIVDKQLQGTI